jgi:hypothetical protein
MIKGNWSRKLKGLVLAAAVVIFAVGCSSALKGTKTGSSKSPSAVSAPAATGPVYHDFNDVLLPRELKVDKDESFILNSPGLTAGVLTLTGSVEASSLIQFFKNKMPADGWQLISSIEAPRTRMLYKKQSRWCVISIAEGKFRTFVEIWLAPSLAGADAGLMK